MLCAGYAAWDDQTMKKRYLGVALAATLLLSGCSVIDLISGAVPSQSTSPTPTAEPEVETPAEDWPVSLTKAEAGERYLQIVCQRNDAIGRWDAAWQELEDLVNAGQEPLSDQVTAVANSARDVFLSTEWEIALLSDERYTWPDVVEAEIMTIIDSNERLLPTLQTEMNARTVDELYASVYPEYTAEEQAAAQEVRLKLGLPGDAVSSCIGYETDAESLYVELQQHLRDTQ